MNSTLAVRVTGLYAINEFNDPSHITVKMRSGCKLAVWLCKLSISSIDSSLNHITVKMHSKLAVWLYVYHY